MFPIWSELPAIRKLVTGVSARLEVSENPDGPSVDSVTIVNAGQHPALLVEGELLEGGWQTRSLVRDVIVASGEPRLVEVACVEQHRWGGGDVHTRRARRATPRVQLSLRENDSARQSRVWNDVERYQSIRHAPTASGQSRRWPANAEWRSE